MKRYENFNMELDDFGTLVIYANNYNYVICEIQDCENLSQEEINRLADEELLYLELITGEYFSAKSDEVAEQNIAGVKE